MPGFTTWARPSAAVKRSIVRARAGRAGECRAEMREVASDHLGRVALGVHAHEHELQVRRASRRSRSAIVASVVGQMSGQFVKPGEYEGPVPAQRRHGRRAARPGRSASKSGERPRLGERRAGTRVPAAPRRAHAARRRHRSRPRRGSRSRPAHDACAASPAQAREPPFQPSRFRNSRRVFGPRVRKCGSGRSR